MHEQLLRRYALIISSLYLITICIISSFVQSCEYDILNVYIITLIILSVTTFLFIISYGRISPLCFITNIMTFIYILSNRNYTYECTIQYRLYDAMVIPTSVVVISLILLVMFNEIFYKYIKVEKQCYSLTISTPVLILASLIMISKSIGLIIFGTSSNGIYIIFFISLIIQTLFMTIKLLMSIYINKLIQIHSQLIDYFINVLMIYAIISRSPNVYDTTPHYNVIKIYFMVNISILSSFIGGYTCYKICDWFYNLRSRRQINNIVIIMHYNL